MLSKAHGQLPSGRNVHDMRTRQHIPPPYSGKYQALPDSTFYMVHGGCKSLLIVPVPLYPLSYDSVIAYPERSKKKQAVNLALHKPLFAIHGNVMYDVYYQSNADTPYLEKEIYQHTLQTSLNITVKDNYPVRVAFTTRMGNSSLFRNLTDLNLQFTNRDFKQMLVQKAQQWDAGKLKQWEELERLKAQINEKANEINQLKRWETAPSQIQRMVEARERALYRKAMDSLEKATAFSAGDINMPGIRGKLEDRMVWPARLKKSVDSLKKEGTAISSIDTTMQQVTAAYAANKKRLDSLQKELAKVEHRYQKKLETLGVKRAYLMDVLMRSRNNKELVDNLAAMNLPDTILPKGYRHLLAIRSVGIGRTLVNYSELTAKDISITGFQAEYNPSYYVAFATGAVDYRFRNFIVNENRSRQYLNLIRLGAGMKEGNNIILTYYTGKKQLYNFNTSGTNSNSAALADYSIKGISLEGRWQLNATNYIIGEAAKSSLPYYARAEHNQSALGSVFQWSNRSNEAYALKAVSFVPKTGTKINAVYKVMGSDFQSFSLYTNGSSQSAWSVRVDQPFFKQRLMLSGGIKQNDFTSHLQQMNYKSNTIFKSIQATLRLRKWPVLSVGYFPSSQLMKLSNELYMENLFYTLVGSMSHFYKYKGIMMNTIFSYTQFYNKQTDSSFLYFNSKNTLLSQTVFLGQFTLNGALSAATNPDYALFGADGNVQYKMNKWLEIGGGLKYNRQTMYDLEQLGYSGNVRIDIPRIGELYFMADKGFVPGMDKRLVPNNNGRLTYTKIF